MTVEPSFAENEKIIERGLHSFVEVGQALMRIRDSRQYKTEANFATFEEYCRERWQLNRPRAYQLMEAADTVEAVSKILDIPPPASDSVARELRGAPGQKAETWQETVKRHGPKPTAKQTRAVAEEKMGKKKITAEQEAEIIRLYFDKNVSMREVAKQVLGIDKNTTPASLKGIIDRERGRREERADAPPPKRGRPKNWNGKTNAKREREIRAQRKATPPGGDYMALVKVQKRINELCSALETVDLDDYEVDEQNLWLITEMYDDLVSLAMWHTRALTRAQTWLGDSDVIRKIEALKNRTVDRGATPEEAETARRLVERLERKLNPVVLD